MSKTAKKLPENEINETKKQLAEIEYIEKSFENIPDFSKECEAKLKELLSKDLFVLTDEDIKKIVSCDFDYSPYNVDIDKLNQLLFRIATANHPNILQIKFEDEAWDISLSIKFFTNPEQVKIIFRDFIQDYPTFALDYSIQKKCESGQSGNSGFKKISMGRVLSLMKQFKFDWV